MERLAFWTAVIALATKVVEAIIMLLKQKKD